MGELSFEFGRSWPFSLAFRRSVIFRRTFFFDDVKIIAFFTGILEYRISCHAESVWGRVLVRGGVGPILPITRENGAVVDGCRPSASILARVENWIWRAGHFIADFFRTYIVRATFPRHREVAISDADHGLFVLAGPCTWVAEWRLRRARPLENLFLILAVSYCGIIDTNGSLPWGILTICCSARFTQA